MSRKNNLIWVDLEMTGLDPEKERIIEIATIVTDADLNILAIGPVIAVHQS
ncbi:MAG: oligoribonuclease, partial [Oleiphilaceae bacterium]